MLALRECDEWLLVHRLTPLGPLPTALDSEGVYPYESYVETSRRPLLRRCRMVVLENEFLRVTVCPDLGGKVHSLRHQPSGREVLFVPPSIRPVRILPRQAFVPGGIEVSFPISHTPVQLERVHCATRRVADRIYAWCGERELRFGMEWTVEYSLGAGDEFLTQRVCFRNPTARTHPWMSWSNAAVPARPDTEFHFPGGPVLCHGDALRTIDWAAQGPRSRRDALRMTGYFWLAPERCAFGAFTPSLGHGLYHVADPAVCPGIKLWTYGNGPHAAWGQAGSLAGEGYVELQGGPCRDQSVKALLAPGERRQHTEFWFPATAPRRLETLELPQPDLAPLAEVPWFDWPPREGVAFWRGLLRAHQARDAAQLHAPPGADQNLWAPSGMDELGEAMNWAAGATAGRARDAWRLLRGAWLAGRDEVDAALEALAQSHDDRAHALGGRLLRVAKQDPRAAVAAYEAIQMEALRWHPQVVVERDLALAALGAETLAQRERWLAALPNCDDEWVIERRAALLADQGRLAEARDLLAQARFQQVHQRYARTRLWQRLERGLGRAAASAPASLGEDDLADFGAYREFTPAE